MKSWPVSIMFEVAGSMVGRAVLALFAATIGVVIAVSILNREIMFPAQIVAIIGLVVMASVFHALSAVFLAGELFLAIVFIRAERVWWLLAAIPALTAAHTFYLVTVLE
jgi:hypothetical protein